MSNQIHLDVVRLEYINKNLTAYGLVMWDNYSQELEDYIDESRVVGVGPLDLLRLAKTYDRFDDLIDAVKSNVPGRGMYIDDTYFDREEIEAVLSEDIEEDEANSE